MNTLEIWYNLPHFSLFLYFRLLDTIFKMEETFSGLNVFTLFVVFSGKALKKEEKKKEAV